VTIADTLISSINVLATLEWMKQIDLAGHWLVQHTAPVSIGVNATGDTRPHSPVIFGQSGTKYLIPPPKFAKFLPLCAKWHDSQLTSLVV